MRYWGPINSPGGIYGNDGYVDGNPGAGIQGSIPTFRTFEQQMRELQNLVVKSGLTPDDVMNGIQVAQSVQNGKITFAVDTGTPNDLAIALDPVPYGYNAGLRVLVKKTPVINNAAMTLNVNGFSPKPIVRPDGNPTRAGDAQPNALLLLGYDGSRWYLLGGGTFGLGDDAFFALQNAVFDTSSTWPVPSHVHNLQVEGWGAGGGGGSGNGTWGGGGGGGGEYRIGWYPVAPGQVINMSVGLGGFGQVSPGNYGGTGGSTVVWITGAGPTTGTLMVCVGGGGGLLDGMQGSTPGQGGSGGAYTISGNGGFPHTATTWGAGGSPGAPAPMSRAYAMQNNFGLAPGGGGSGCQSDNYSPTGLGYPGANGRVKLMFLRGPT
jgi:hypothetical protein